jgi:glutaredoxin-related protein
MKIYATPICSGCRKLTSVLESRGITEFTYINVTENVPNMRDYLKIRDSEPIFSEIRKAGRIGTPFFVRDDGYVTLDIDEAFSWIGQPPVMPEELIDPLENSACDSCK